MFRSSIKLFRLFGIEVRLDYSWFIIFALIAYYFGFSYFPSVLSGVGGGYLTIITLVTTILFFFSVLFHEMSHSVVAKKMGIPVEKISLFIFGGMAEIEREPDSPQIEFVMAIAGPASSFFLAILFGTIWAFTRNIVMIGEPSKYLALVNVALGVFNLLPGYPLDGGRVLRSIIWKFSGSLQQATFVASNSGRVIGFLIIAWGFFFFFTGNFLNGIWLVFIGWFLQSAATSGYRQLVFESSIKGIKVKDIMNENVVSVTKDVTLEDLVNNYFMKYRYGRFPVIENEESERLIGVISVHDIKEVPREDWVTTTAGQVVKPVSDLEIVGMNVEVSEAIKKMTKNDLGHLVIMSGDRIAGLITKSDVMRFIKLRSELLTKV
ncbi:MAG: site-2 protease family protein [Actinobacteria bacterium]|nr:site-2 protease family protein [Actinomycetota bacterium]